MTVGRFDEDEFVFPDFVEDAHALPHADDGFHVQVGGEEDDDAVGSYLGKFHQERPVVSDDARFVPDLETRGDGGLVTTACDDHRKEGAACESHAIRFLNYGREAKHFRVHLKGRDGTGRDDDRAEAVEDWFDGDGSVEAGKVQDGVGDRGRVRFKGLEDKQKAFVVGCSKSGKRSYFLQWLVVFDVCELQRPYQGSQTLCTKSKHS